MLFRSQAIAALKDSTQVAGMRVRDVLTGNEIDVRARVISASNGPDMRLSIAGAEPGSARSVARRQRRQRAGHGRDQAFDAIGFREGARGKARLEAISRWAAARSDVIR